MTKFNTIRDFLWVLQAFLRGKLLRQKAYCPQPYVQGLSVFYAVPGTTPHRMSLLAKAWGYRPLLVDGNLTTLMEQMSKQDDDSGRAPFLNWTGSGWEKKDDLNDWDNSHRFIAVRH